MNPYKVKGPTCISFSGGRTSAFMLWQVLIANGERPLDKEIVVCFANTGKEDEATLQFVLKVAEKWSVPIHFLEYRPDGFVEVSFMDASRNGEPFEAIIRKREMLPNPISRFCTVELKIRTMHRFLRARGWSEWDQFIGIRADEQRRVAKIRANPHPEGKHETMVLPLADHGVTLSDIDDFWTSQDFRLKLPTVNGKTLAGNCDLCFLKAANQVQTLIAENPSKAVWWAQMEDLATMTAKSKNGQTFRIDRPSYRQMMQNTQDQKDWVGYGDSIECFCGD